MESAWDYFTRNDDDGEDIGGEDIIDDEGDDDGGSAEPEPILEGEGATEVPAEETPSEDVLDDSFLPEDLRLGTIESPEVELDRYRAVYQNFVKKFGSEEGINTFVGLYEKNLVEADQRLEGQIAEFLAFKENKEEYLRSAVPELAIAAGLPFVPDNETVANTIHETMVEKYGEGWQEMYNEFDRFKVGSVSHKIMTDYEKMQAAANAHVQDMKAKYDQHMQALSQKKSSPVSSGGLTEQNLESIIEQEFKVFEANGFTREEYQRYVEEAKKSELRLYDVYRAQNFDKLIEAEKAKWKDEGKKEYLASLKKAGRMAEVKASEVPKARTKARESGPYDKAKYYREQEQSHFG